VPVPPIPPTAIEWSVVVSGDTPADLIADFRKVEMRMRDWRPAWDLMHREYAAYEEQVFASEGSAHPGGRWKPLSPRYAEWKELHYPGRTILTRTGRLRREAQAMGVREPLRAQMGPGNRVEYAAPAGAIRPYIEPSPMVVIRLQEIAKGWLAEAVERATQ
jgi:hypothetical protein